MRFSINDYFESIHTGNIYQLKRISDTETYTGVLVFDRVGYFDVDRDFVENLGIGCTITESWLIAAIQNGMWREIFRDKLSGNFMTADEIADMADFNV